jgi:glycosyltransferase involved in cell wall biosynthesis
MSDLGPGGHASGKKKVLVFCDSYLPSIQSGGGMWTVVNLVERFADRYDFFVVTRNYDGKGDRRPFTTVKTGEWNSVGNARVFYLAADDVTQASSVRLVREVAPELVFLNSSMSGPCMKFLVARRRGLIDRRIPVVLAATGELSDGCLADKTAKKKLYLAAARATGLFDGILWKASTELEVGEIRRRAGAKSDIAVAADLTPKTILPDYDAAAKPAKVSGEARLIFYSRIVPKKNLRFLLEVLQTIQNGSVILDVVGPFENMPYWRECEELIAKLPANITVNVAGPVAYETGLERLFASHFFVLPTLNENFGYVFIESMAAGTPVITSENVVWTDWEENNAGLRIPLGDQQRWRQEIERCIAMDTDEFGATSDAARRYALDWLGRTDAEEANAKVFESALKGR